MEPLIVTAQMSGVVAGFASNQNINNQRASEVNTGITAFVALWA
jgi:hypothetical protein